MSEPRHILGYHLEIEGEVVLVGITEKDEGLLSIPMVEPDFRSDARIEQIADVAIYALEQVKAEYLGYA